MMMSNPEDGSGDSPGLDVTTMMELAKLMGRARQEMDDVMGRIVSSTLQFNEVHDQLWGEFVKAALAASQRMQEGLPANWPQSGLSGVWGVMVDDGIPLAYVPRPDTVRAILDQPDYGSRMEVVARNRVTIAEDCRIATADAELHRMVADLGNLIGEAQSLLADGYLAGAQCLAVNLSDTIVKRTMEPRWRYPKIVQTIKESGFDDELLSVSLAFRPVLSFYAVYTIGESTPPVQLSRHRTAHDLSPDHASEHNATIAVMLATSLALAVTEWCNWLDRDRDN